MRSITFQLTILISACCFLLCLSHPSTNNVRILENESGDSGSNNENRNYKHNKKAPSLRKSSENSQCGYEVKLIFFCKILNVKVH